MLNKLLGAFCLTLFMAAGTAQVYTWKDSKGVTQFSDTPPVGTDAKPVRGNAKAAPPVADASAPAAAPSASGPKSWQEKDLEFRQRKAAQAEAADKTQKEAAQKAERESYCQSIRQNISMMEAGGRITRPNQKGEKEFMTDGQMSQEAERLRAQLGRDCK